jgi:Bacterial membrane protein YfhO
VRVFKRRPRFFRADWWRNRRADLGALATILLFFSARFGRGIWHRQFLITGDAFFYSLPLRTAAWAMIEHGTLPLWTPLVLSGYPMLAMSQLGLGYPLTWGYLFLPNYWAEEIFILAPFIFAPAFTYAYARTVGRTRPAALLAALSYGYGGVMTNAYGINSVPTNALMWLPLMLCALERARTRPFVPSLLLATAAYTLSVLAGHGQSFLQVGLLALAYALFLACVAVPTQAATNEQTRAGTHAQPSWARWRPLFVALGAITLASGVAACEILETLRAARRSIRSSISYGVFTAGSFTPAETLRSFIAPLYHYVEVTTYQAPLVCVLGGAAIALASRRRNARDVHVFFWFAVALLAWWLMLGGHTPLYRLLYRVPVFNLFRYPSRHAFEWSFALSMLGAYGWDAMAARFGVPARAPASRTGLKVSIGLLALLTSIVLGLLWWHAFRAIGVETSYVRWKLWFTLATTFAIGYSWRVLAPPWRTRLAICALLLVCFVEPFILIGLWWGTGKTSAQLTTPALTTSWLQQFPPTEQRVYVHLSGDEEEGARRARFDALARTAPYGLHNVGGYEQLLFERYSRALGNVDADCLGQRPGLPVARSLFEPESHVLDLLNAGFVVARPDLKPFPDPPPIKRDGVEFALSDLALEVQPGAVVSMRGASGTGDTLILVTTLANGGALKQGAIVARLRIFTTDGQVVERELQAGRDTAEWAHERADVRAHVKHQLAPVFDSRAADEADSYAVLRYWTRLPLGFGASISRIEIANLAPPATLTIWKATLHDSHNGRSTPLTNGPDVVTLDPAHWQVVANIDGVMILRNQRALPRVWLVTAAEAVTGDEALSRIRGATPQEFDPRRTALVEVRAAELPPLPGGTVAAESTARIVNYEPTRLAIETSAPSATVLVVSELFYPGWAAKVDGQGAPILLTDYLLRGVALPAGRHTVELRYTAPAARTGAIISAFTLSLLVALTIYAWRRRSRQP